MNNSFTLIRSLLILSLPFVIGCRDLNKVDSQNALFPAMVGPFKQVLVYKEEERSYINGKNKDQKYKVSNAKYTDGTNDIFYFVGSHPTANDAVNEQPESVRHNNCVVWRTFDLKEKSGKSVGKLTICRETEISAEKMKDIGGGWNYSIAFNIANQEHSAYVSDLMSTKSPDLTNKLVDFIKSLPAASDLELGVLDLVTPAFADKVVTAERLAAISPAVKPGSEVYLKGKIAVIVSGAPSSGLATDVYIDDPSRHAYLLADVRSIVKIACEKGRRIGEYEVKEKGIRIPAFGSTCKVAIIDKTIPSVIAQKQFEGVSLVDFRMVRVDKRDQLSRYDEEYVAPIPSQAIKDYLQKLPKK